MTHSKSPGRQKTFRRELPNDITADLVERLRALPNTVKAVYLKEQMLSKFVSSETDPAILRRTRAITKWLETEERNEITELRLLQTPEDYQILPRVELQDFVEWCRSYTLSIIGELPAFDVLIGSFSGGASTSRKRTESQPARKYVGEAHVTPRALGVFVDLFDEMPLWCNAQSSLRTVVREVPGNVLFTVPKKTDIDRVAAKEPDLNMFMQKGIGNYFRRCLLNAGINLNDQSINRSLARVGSIDGSLSTLDLSSASDSVTRELVFQVLPAFWFTLLDSVRSPVTIIDGVEHRNCMFSSMGNGFTFELESLLFYVLARATAYFTGTRGVVSVYGDDIICPTGMSADLVRVLNFFGFLVNEDKSFVEGPFRESCGGHYHDGYDITPFYIRGPITTIDHLIDVANKLRQWGEFPGTKVSGGIIDPDVEGIWLWLKSMVPSYLWGGVDTSFKYQLASNDVPLKRLREEKSTKGAGTLGGYLHWHNATMDRASAGDGLETSSFTVSKGTLRLVPALPSTVNRLPALFLHEIGLTSG